MRNMRNAFCSKILKEIDNSEDLDIDERTILDWILGKQSGKVWTGFIWFRIRTSSVFM